MKEFIQIPEHVIKPYLEKLDKQPSKRQKYITIWQWIKQGYIEFSFFPFFCEYVSHPQNAINLFIGNVGHTVRLEKRKQPKNRKYYFWLKSSRGTDVSQIKDFPENVFGKSIDFELKNWCSQFGAWQVSENCCTYGYDTIPSNTKFTADEIRIEKNAEAHANKTSLEELKRMLNFYLKLENDEGLYKNRITEIMASILYRLAKRQK